MTVISIICTKSIFKHLFSFFRFLSSSVSESESESLCPLIPCSIFCLNHHTDPLCKTKVLCPQYLPALSPKAWSSRHLIDLFQKERQNKTKQNSDTHRAHWGKTVLTKKNNTHIDKTEMLFNMKSKWPIYMCIIPHCILYLSHAHFPSLYVSWMPTMCWTLF